MISVRLPGAPPVGADLFDRAQALAENQGIGLERAMVNLQQSAMVADRLQRAMAAFARWWAEVAAPLLALLAERASQVADTVRAFVEAYGPGLGEKP